jgi:hypothetical protein
LKQYLSSLGLIAWMFPEHIAIIIIAFTTNPCFRKLNHRHYLKRHDLHITIMTGETNLSTLLATMQPILHDGEYVFCTVAPSSISRLAVSSVGQFLEAEGMTLILRREEADQRGLPYDYVARMITLSVHSSLSAVGFLAAIATALAQEGISVNPVSAYYHDHLFVPGDRKDDAMRVLAQVIHSASDVADV